MISFPLPSFLRYIGLICPLVVLVLGSVALSSSARGQTPSSPPSPSMSSLTDLLAPQALPDSWIGKAGAPITIIEYASMTCPHCAAFHTNIYPKLKEKYIDTGKARFTLREFPVDTFSAAGFMLGRCVAPDKRNALLELLFDQQGAWVYSDTPLVNLENIVKQAGLNHAAFEACLRNRTLYEKVSKVRDEASQNFNITGTPTFFVNGKRVVGEVSFEKWSEILDEMLPQEKK